MSLLHRGNTCYVAVEKHTWLTHRPLDKFYEICQILLLWRRVFALQWCHNDRDGVSNHQPHHCLLKHLFGCRSRKTSKLLVTGLCVWNSPGTGEFPAQMASYAEKCFHLMTSSWNFEITSGWNSHASSTVIWHQLRPDGNPLLLLIAMTTR